MASEILIPAELGGRLVIYAKHCFVMSKINHLRFVQLALHILLLGAGQLKYKFVDNRFERTLRHSHQYNEAINDNCDNFVKESDKQSLKLLYFKHTGNELIEDTSDKTGNASTHTHEIEKVSTRAVFTQTGHVLLLEASSQTIDDYDKSWKVIIPSQKKPTDDKPTNNGKMTWTPETEIEMVKIRNKIHNSNKSLKNIELFGQVSIEMASRGLGTASSDALYQKYRSLKMKSICEGEEMCAELSSLFEENRAGALESITKVGPEEYFSDDLESIIKVEPEKFSSSREEPIQEQAVHQVDFE